MGFLSLRNDPPTVVFNGDHTLENPFLHGFLKEQGQVRYEGSFQRALRIGAQALVDGRIGVVLSRVEANLDAELQSLHHLLRIAGRVLRDLPHLDGLGKNLTAIRDAAKRILDTATGAEERLQHAARSLRAIEGQVERLVAGDAPTPAELMALLADEVTA